MQSHLIYIYAIDLSVSLLSVSSELFSHIEGDSSVTNMMETFQVSDPPQITSTSEEKYPSTLLTYLCKQITLLG